MVSERKRRKKTFRRGERISWKDPFMMGQPQLSGMAERKVSSPEPMTKEEFKEWRAGEGKDATERAERRAEIAGTPTWMTMSGFFPTAPEAVIDKKTEDNLTREGRGMGTVDKCQLDNEGVAASYRKQLDPKNTGSWRTFQRVAIFPDTNKGKADAEKAAEAIREGKRFKAEPATQIEGGSTSRTYAGAGESRDDEGPAWTDFYEEDIQVRVLRVYCRDVPKPAKYWTVWVGRAVQETASGGGTRQATGQSAFRTDSGYRSGLRGRARTRKGYHSGGTAAIRNAVACPKCEAPIGENCTKGRMYPDAIRMLEAGELTRAQAFGNPHRERIEAFKETLEEEEDNGEV